MTATVYGVREALRELRKVDATLRRQLQAEMRQAAGPLRQAITAGIPRGAPLSGMNNRGRLGWKNPHRLSTRTGGRRNRGRNTIPLLRVLVLSPAVQMADMAAEAVTPQGAAMLDNLPGGASRYVWPAARRALPAVSADAAAVCDRIMTAVNRELARPPTR